TTNRNIYQCVTEGQFREDLFYRLNVFPLHISPLRERVEDILPLANKLLNRYSNAGETVYFSETAKRLLKTHFWPGNVRELDNVVQRALILRAGNTIEDKDIHLEDKVSNLQPVMNQTDQLRENESGLSSDLRAHEHDLIISALQAKTSRKEVAKRLGISSRTLRYKLAKMRDAGVAIPA
ncbi:MAG: sigma 54-interacting transcriptional regulator, partial [Gammaproteobacteria bacterium]|nr:sigma 54-interacting transcriptional regulator [Gammaproteobacteria bacterium]